MGCDIHCYIEYRYREDSGDGWRSFGGRINPGRSYEIFAALAGVRGPQWANGIKPRGVPNDMGYAANDDWWVHILDSQDASPQYGDEFALMTAALINPTDDMPRRMLLDELQSKYGTGVEPPQVGRVSTCTLEQAKSWSSFKAGEVVERGGKAVAVRHPDWHTPSWHTPDEWASALNICSTILLPRYYAMLAAMRSLEEAGSVRVVFWFDN